MPQLHVYQPAEQPQLTCAKADLHHLACLPVLGHPNSQRLGLAGGACVVCCDLCNMFALRMTGSNMALSAWLACRLQHRCPTHFGRKDKSRNGPSWCQESKHGSCHTAKETPLHTTPCLCLTSYITRPTVTATHRAGRAVYGWYSRRGT